MILISHQGCRVVPTFGGPHQLSTSFSSAVAWEGMLVTSETHELQD